MGRLNVTLCGIELDNPVIPASGTFGYGHEFAEFYDINVLGSFSCKGTTLAPRFGNATPRIAEAPAGMINAVGLQNPGVDAVIAEELPRLAQCFHKPILANVSGFSMEEYAAVYQKAIKDFQDANKTALDSGGGAGGGKAEKMKAGASMTAGSDTFYKALVESMSPGNYETTMKETTKRIFDATTHGNTLAQEGNAYLLQMAQAMNGFGNIGVFGG